MKLCNVRVGGYNEVFLFCDYSHLLGQRSYTGLVICVRGQCGGYVLPCNVFRLFGACRTIVICERVYSFGTLLLRGLRRERGQYVLCEEYSSVPSYALVNRYDACCYHVVQLYTTKYG